MPTLIEQPKQVEAAGTPPKIIQEYIGRVNTGDEHISIAHMQSPSGWAEPGQRPEFDEYTIVLKGELQVKGQDGNEFTVQAGQAVCTAKGEWVQYTTPGPEGAEYIAVCLPAFSPLAVHREA